MLAPALAMLLLAGPAEPSEAETAPVEAAEPAATGNLQLGPDARGLVQVLDAEGGTVAEVTLRPGDTITLPLRPGTYRLVGAEGRALHEVKVLAGQSVHGELPPDMRAEPLAPAPEPSSGGSGPALTDEVSVVPTPEGSPASGEAPLRVTRRQRWRRIGAPILSAVVPGLGQAVNRQPGKAIAFFTGTASLALASAALWTARDPTEGATPGEGGHSNAQEVLRLGAFAAFTGAAGMLYLAQIMDAYAEAAGKQARPAKGHAVALSVTRNSTVGFAPGQPAYDLYNDWSLAVLGQIVPRLTFGLSDASVKWHRARDALTVQAGLQVAYRFFDRRRVWLSAGGGAIMQGTTAKGQPDTILADADPPGRQRRFAVIPYVHFETRFFVLDRWYLGIVPRLSVPLAERRFRRDQALPRYATTFELGLSAGVLF